MAGHGEKLPRMQERAIDALLTSPTVEAAAAKAGVGYRTLRGWLHRPDFLAAYREARRRIVETVIARLQRAGAKAVARLVRNLRCGVPAAENTAAKTILDHALGGVELLDLVARVEELETRLKGSAQ